MSAHLKSNSKGQLFSTDSIFALSIFVAIIILSFSLYTNQITKNISIEEQNKMSQRSFQIADFLVRTQGYPNNWSSATVKLIGLAKPDHVLLVSKINELDSLTYDELRIKLKTLPYNFLLNITSSLYNYSNGQVWNESATYISVEERSVIIDTGNSFERGLLRFYLWK